MEGSLSKWTNVMKGWQYRWFVLDDNAGLLSYYTSREKMMRGVRRGCVRLKGAVIGIDDEDDSTFTITVDSKTFHFQARDGDEREKWVRCLEDTILRHAYGFKSSSSDFDKKLAESDSYLQMVIDHTKAVETKMSTLTDPDLRNRCEIICQHANSMLEQMKHTIVLLQIAKNTAHPVNGTYQPMPLTDSDNTKSIDGVPSAYIPYNNSVEVGIEIGSECEDTQHSRMLPTAFGGAKTPSYILEDLPVVLPSSLSTPRVAVSEKDIIQSRVPRFFFNFVSHGNLPLPVVVPETSYSSSEEEDFFDAYDSSESSAGNPAASKDDQVGEEFEEEPCPLPSTQAENGESSHASSSRTAAPATRNFIKPDGTIDYDLLYEPSSEDTTNISMESQGSVVTHLLSQVKIGMDLTKVVLPTFILETRSLLEMYADYFAHPDMFIRIADLETEKDRMVQVVLWYLCSYHAGRKSSVAKKPYNPILGEFFQCHWNLEDYEADPNAQLIEDGPVPWCNGNQLTFIAEQVSHHPPISAFYAEHYNKRISFNAHVWTKSKFLGLSIGVHNIGSGVINVIDYDEKYTVTFPNGYGRSILTVPWIELGGVVNIACEKTGYKAVVEFITKPFYGGKKHRITGEIFAPNEKKPFVTITGEWNGVMEAKWSDGRCEPFADVHKLTIINKTVRPIEFQDENESRRLWKEVTAGLRMNNVAQASNAKCNLEQKQRLEAQQRKTLGLAWETKLFQPGDEDNWVFMKPLADRLKANVR
ncbi:oxysterol-binding protein-related protein 9 isoform X2 [Cimex lectularius]|uniref:Oxysterol-binding protein n=2 Tax=Cimex lectularius TaxID=79782 RepID=A0A8I6RTM5_CIMLE|nr:oxysterol-binding protein-related protein 9 isoform X2 [Cimex lectularius]